jgi:1-acyl-sn-glycerol-3-phosphate acyltransferase
MRDRDAFETSGKIRFLHGVNRLVSRAYHHVEVTGAASVPRRGPVVIVSNHISSLDPLLIQSVVQRPIIWMVAKEYVEIGPLRWLFRSIRSIPVSRDGRDSTALRAALRALSAGRVLGVFPEGRIAKTRQMLPLQTGAALLAIRAVAPVVPVYQFGTTFRQPMVRAILSPQHVRVRFGAAVRVVPDSGTPRTPEAVTAELEKAMSNLRRAVDVENNR